MLQLQYRIAANNHPTRRFRVECFMPRCSGTQPANRLEKLPRVQPSGRRPYLSESWEPPLKPFQHHNTVFLTAFRGDPKLSPKWLRGSRFSESRFSSCDFPRLYFAVSVPGSVLWLVISRPTNKRVSVSMSPNYASSRYVQKNGFPLGVPHQTGNWQLNRIMINSKIRGNEFTCVVRSIFPPLQFFCHFQETPPKVKMRFLLKSILLSRMSGTVIRGKCFAVVYIHIYRVFQNKVHNLKSI